MPLPTMHSAAAEAAPWLERLARAGFAVKGLLYLTIGVLSARAAIGAGGRAVTDTHGAMGTLGEMFGRPGLVVIAIGLAGYGVWAVISAFTDAEDRGRDASGIAKRIGAALRGLAHLAFAGTAASLAIWETKSKGTDDTARHWTGELLEWPGGSVIVGAIAVGVVIYGLYELYCAWTAKLDKELELDTLGSSAHRIVVAISRFGIAARGVVFVMLAVLFARAAMSRNANEAGGTGDSMRELFAFGRAPFIAIAIGLAAYGLYQLLNARFRRVRAR